MTRDWQQLPPFPSMDKYLYGEKFGDDVVVSIFKRIHHLKKQSSGNFKLLSYNLSNGNRKWAIQDMESSKRFLLDKRWCLYDFHGYFNKYTVSFFYDLKCGTNSIMIDSDYHHQSFYVMWMKSKYTLDNPSATKYYIIEYHKNYETLPTKPAQKGIYNCPMDFSEYEKDSHNNNMKLYACEGYLMVVVSLCRKRNRREEVSWLYNLVTCTWTALDLPQLQSNNYILDGKLTKVKWTTRYNLQQNGRQ